MKATRERKAQLRRGQTHERRQVADGLDRRGTCTRRGRRRRRPEAAGQAGKRGGKRVHESSDLEGALASEASRWRVGGAELGAGD
jgi:hypothetical protein